MRSSIIPLLPTKPATAALTARGIPINTDLPLTESDNDVELRAPDEVLHRLVALWAITGTTSLRDKGNFQEYCTNRKYESWLSEGESVSVLGKTAPSGSTQSTHGGSNLFVFLPDVPGWSRTLRSPYMSRVSAPLRTYSPKIWRSRAYWPRLSRSVRLCP